MRPEYTILMDFFFISGGQNPFTPIKKRIKMEFKAAFMHFTIVLHNTRVVFNKYDSSHYFILIFRGKMWK